MLVVMMVVMVMMMMNKKNPSPVSRILLNLIHHEVVHDTAT
jgi:hypothetical protein